MFSKIYNLSGHLEGFFEPKVTKTKALDQRIPPYRPPSTLVNALYPVTAG